jgi:hypothetical protein
MDDPSHNTETDGPYGPDNYLWMCTADKAGIVLGCKTPEEAVAKLWLGLNKNKNEAMDNK